ncbi:hypothetical protein A5636_13695 [Mycobacterium asiaticum]|uniref:DUF6542 domain-containing protein n=1 Tax=Mycobacterium asiaticum TaxID=1790 RepID=A0A1A3MR69_MYCAS|nr:hypothetical protein A5636_13695 [Mycobacterium asiaticum]
MEPGHRSIVPNIPGVPWWAAVVIAVGLTAVGYAIDAGQKELTHVFAACYIAGCVAAVLAVRQAAVFTAVIQPPLILFCSVPAAYWLFHGGKVDKFKDLLINCGYPLIERFPLMLGTAGGVLLLGMIRWYFGKHAPTTTRTSRAAKAGSEDAPKDEPQTSWFSGIVAKFTELLTGDSDDNAETAARPAHVRNRSARTSRTARSDGRSAQRAARNGSRRARPSLDDTYESDGERPRRSPRRPSADYDPADPPPRPRRRRPPEEPDLGAPPPREMRREPHSRRASYERSYDRAEPRGRRFNPYETYDRPEPSERSERRNRHERRPSYDRYDAYEPPYEPLYEPRRRRAAPNGSNRTNGTSGINNGAPSHHPISQVRYRGQAPANDPRDEPGRRSRSRTPRREYDD